MIDKIKKGGQKFEPVKRLASFVEKQKGRNIFVAYKEVWIGIIALTAVALLMFGVFLSTLNRVAPEMSNNFLDGILQDTDRAPRHPLSGMLIEEPLEKLPQVFAVMVENSADAWPLSGLDKAFLVIEAPVESGIPRFITFFSEEDTVQKIGPVRSARPYYLDWADEFQAVYAHVGGSPDALNLIRNVYETIDLNEFWQGEYFYRQNKTRYAPHNAYTTSANLIESLKELKLNSPTYGVWKFKDGEVQEDQYGLSVAVDFADGKTYDVDWRYDKEINAYTRYQGTGVMHMEDGATIVADNVVILATDIRTIDNEGRKSVVTVGEGDAWLFQDGKSNLVRWKKETRTDRLRFFTTSGEEIQMNAGKTWIEIVSSLSQARTY